METPVISSIIVVDPSSYILFERPFALFNFVILVPASIDDNDDNDDYDKNKRTVELDNDEYINHG